VRGDRCEEEQRLHVVGHILGAVEVTLAGGATDHQGARHHEARPQAPHRCDDLLHAAALSRAKILVEDEERRHRAHLAAIVPNCEITVIESLLDGVLDDLVIAAVLALSGEGASPSAAPRELGAGQHVDARRLQRNKVGLEVPGKLVHERTLG
jgi:hypothetical protein